MKWLIVEDSLRDRRGHWYEYIATFYREFRASGDDVVVLADREAEAFIREEFQAQPVLPASVWHSPAASGALQRMLRIPLHAWRTYRAVRAHLRAAAAPDVVLVPTVAVHHLLAWVFLAKGPFRKTHTKIILVFIHLPLRWDDARRQPAWDNSATSRLLQWLFAWLRTMVTAGRVVLAAEPDTLRQALATLVQLPVVSVPQPVHRYRVDDTTRRRDSIFVASYGGARAEKGSDLQQRAILAFLERHPQTRMRFGLQWGDDFLGDDGRRVCLDPRLAMHPRVEMFPRFFVGEQHAQALARTDAVLLPYQLSSYRLRGSRVVIEAMVNGLPIIATRGSSMARQMTDDGAGVLFDDGDIESFVAALATLERDYAVLREQAQARQAGARRKYSVAAFRAALPSATAPSFYAA